MTFRMLILHPENMVFTFEIHAGTKRRSVKADLTIGCYLMH
jgi:hypothetical protein